MPAILVPVENAAIKIESALVQILGVLTSAAYTGIVANLPDIITKSILPAIGNVVDQAVSVVNQFVNSTALGTMTSVLESAASFVGATYDMLPSAAQALADKAQRFLNMAIDFVSSGLEHLKAIVDLLGRAAQALVGHTLTALTQGTKDALALEGIALPATVT